MDLKKIQSHWRDGGAAVVPPGLTLVIDGAKTWFHWDINNSAIVQPNVLTVVEDEGTNDNDGDEGPDGGATVQNRTIGGGPVKTARCDNGKCIRLPAGLTESIVAENFSIFLSLELDDGQNDPDLVALFGLNAVSTNTLLIWMGTGSPSADKISFRLQNPTDGLVDARTNLAPFADGPVGQTIIECRVEYAPDNQMSIFVNGVEQALAVGADGDLTGWDQANWTATARALFGDAVNGASTFNGAKGLNLIRPTIAKDWTAQETIDGNDYLMI